MKINNFILLHIDNNFIINNHNCDNMIRDIKLRINHRSLNDLISNRIKKDLITTFYMIISIFFFFFFKRARIELISNLRLSACNFFVGKKKKKKEKNFHIELL